MIDETDNFNQGEFLAHYWHKQPLLIRSYLPDFKDPIEPEELAGLACEELIESRLVRYEHNSWQLQNGPFNEAHFQQLPKQNWTLLIQAVDQWVEQVADLKKQFSYLPDWRIEDVMISYATDGGGVGPHFDSYDVFLLQGAGSRRWQIGPRCDKDAALVPNSDLKLLADFHSQQEFNLGSGDVLYLPPRIPHHGVSTGNSLCYSIGFRAPSFGEMLLGFTDQLIHGLDEERRFSSDQPRPAQHAGEIDPDTLNETFTALLGLTDNQEKFLLWFGCNATEPKYPELIEPPETALTLNEVLRELKAGCKLAKCPSSRFAYMQLSSVLHLFVNGRHFSVPISALGSAQHLCNCTKFEASDVEIVLPINEIQPILEVLLNQGSLLLEK
jgi:50S ribosomal protein L16 3-hydroxylase